MANNGTVTDSERYSRPDEDPGERLDRQWNELLQELRLAQTGTQILFAFLLSIAFQKRFQDADAFTYGVYAVTLLWFAVFWYAVPAWVRRTSASGESRR